VHVSNTDHGVRERELPVRYLGSPQTASMAAGAAIAA
jgi:hypothetical protein